jgi:hypothetical protein
MNDVALPNEPPCRRPIRLWLWIVFAVAIVLAANAHLIYVAVSSQPACVTHVRQGEGSTDRGRFSAAESSCSPEIPGDRS